MVQEGCLGPPRQGSGCFPAVFKENDSMNLLGKIFVVFIVLTSFGLMLLSMVVYATHKNWKDEANTVRDNLSKAETENGQLQSRYQNLESRLTAELEAAQQEVRKLESERVALQDQNTAIQKDLDQLKQDRRQATAMVASTQESNVGLMKEVTNMRQEMRATQQARDQAFATTLTATSELHEKQNQLTSAVERMKQLLQQMGKHASLLKRNGIDPNIDPDTLTPHVRGVVNATHRSAGSQLIEISIGADDGLRPGHTVEVFRGDRYLGRAEILKTEPDRAVARILRRFQKGQIQEGDDVATKLRIG
jgi:multidrug efflux pump subunit AcrA (membrane-fusion protein)